MVVVATPRVVTVKLRAVPAVACAAAALVNDGTFWVVVDPAALTVRVSVWVAVPAVLVAVTGIA